MKQEGQVKIKQIAEPTAELERDKMMKDARGCTCKSTVLYRTPAPIIVYYFLYYHMFIIFVISY